jgi:hypothetical protein
MTAPFAYEFGMWCFLLFLVATVASIALFTRLNLDVIRGDKKASGYEFGKSYAVRQILRMHKTLFKKSWTRRIFRISVGVQLLAFIPYAVLNVNDMLHDRLFHLISAGR